MSPAWCSPSSTGRPRAASWSPSSASSAYPSSWSAWARGPTTSRPSTPRRSSTPCWAEARPVRVSVVFDPGYDDELRAMSLASLEAQTYADWEVVTSLSEATGDYLAFLDAADVWEPDRL